MKPTIQKILFPTDFSEGADMAASFALDLAERYGATLHVIHVIYDIATSSSLYASQVNVEDLYEEMKENAAGVLDEHVKKYFGAFGAVEQVLLRGSPSEDILRYADEHGIDLIVMGSHGRKVLDRMLFGSSATRVVKNSRCPVLTVRTPQRR